MTRKNTEHAQDQAFGFEGSSIATGSRIIGSHEDPVTEEDIEVLNQIQGIR